MNYMKKKYYRLTDQTLSYFIMKILNLSKRLGEYSKASQTSRFFQQLAYLQRFCCQWFLISMTNEADLIEPTSKLDWF